ncbi:MAG: 1-deoxy-D-xylulose-5-phosphate synthase [Bacillota bacterium]
MGYLEAIDGPEDLRALSTPQLKELAKELRQLILSTVASNGGHLGPNLGSIEITLALHSVYRSPEDRVIWDVGHQCYAHKIITGRRDAFKTLRQYGGIGGYPNPEESPHDAFIAGHASTSVSAALGLAKARDLRGQKHQVIAVIGDGSLSGGMAFEALNYAGQEKTHLIVILNDNSMCISPNVGALAGYLNRLRTHPAYHRLKADFEETMARIPLAGSMAKTVERLKDSIKYLVVPGMLFEDLGFTYLGPVDGHDIPALQRVLRSARDMEGPILVHAVTKKGLGYEPAEENPDMFHGIGPFDMKSARPLPRGENFTYSRVFGDAMVELGRQDDRVTAITAAMTSGTGLSAFFREFPARSFDVGIAEQNAVTFSAGLAAAGLRPVVAIYSTFLQRAYDQIVHDVCLPRLPVVFALDRAGIVADDGSTHQGLFDYAYLRHIPNITVMAPRDGATLRSMLATALAHSGPSALRYPKTQVQGDPGGPLEPIDIGRAEVLREGDDVLLLAVGSTVLACQEAAGLLEAQGIHAAVVDARFVKPLDYDTIKRAASPVSLVLTVEEHAMCCGFGSAVLEAFSRMGVPVPVRMLGVPDLFVPHGSRDIFLSQFGLGAGGIARIVQEELSRLPGHRRVTVSRAGSGRDE